MVEFMEKNGDLSKPTGGPRGRQWAIKKWQELTTKLNSEGAGDSRSEDKWRKVWSDLKNNTKKKWSKINRAACGTGGGPALNLCLTDIENRVMAILGVQAASGMAVPEIGFGKIDGLDSSEQDTPVPPEGLTQDVENTVFPSTMDIIIGDEDWNSPSTSSDPTTLRPCISPSLPKHPSPQLSPIPIPVSPARISTPPPAAFRAAARKLPFHRNIGHRSPKKRKLQSAEELFLKCEAVSREDNRERDRMYVELERERIRQRDVELRQRDTELQLQAQWLEFMKEALHVLERILNARE